MRVTYQKRLLLEQISKGQVKQSDMDRLSELSHLPTRAELLRGLCIKLPSPDVWLDCEESNRRFVDQNNHHRQTLLSQLIAQAGCIDSRSGTTVSLRDLMLIACPSICSYSNLYVFGHERQWW